MTGQMQVRGCRPGRGGGGLMWSQRLKLSLNGWCQKDCGKFSQTGGKKKEEKPHALIVSSVVRLLRLLVSWETLLFLLFCKLESLAVPPTPPILY